MELKELRILITGGAGFVGSHIADRLLEMNNKVMVYDNFDPFYSGKEQNISHNLKNKSFKLLGADILDYDTLKVALKNVDVVFHEAAQPGVRFSIKNPAKSHQVNTTGTINVLLAAKETGVKKVIFASSSSVYGIPNSLPISEKHPTNPTSPYAVSKLAAEKYCKVFQEVYGLNIVSLRYFSVYGPRGRPDQVIYSFVSNVLKGEPPVIYGDGTQTRDFTYISDVVDATILAARVDGIAGEVFNIGAGSQISIKGLANTIIKLARKDGIITPIFKESYAGDFPHTFANIQKAEKLLGYKPKAQLKEGLQAFIEWYKLSSATQSGLA